MNDCLIDGLGAFVSDSGARLVVDRNEATGDRWCAYIVRHDECFDQVPPARRALGYASPNHALHALALGILRTAVHETLED